MPIGRPCAKWKLSLCHIARNRGSAGGCSLLPVCRTPLRRMVRVSVKALTIGVGSYLSLIGGGYYWALSTGYEEAEKEKEQKRRARWGPSRRLREDERRLVFDESAASYDEKITFDELMMGLKLLRWWLLRKSKGKVLEVAGGTCRNLKYFPDNIQSLTIIDFASNMLGETEKKLRAQRRVDVQFGVMDVQRMTLPSHSFDTVVDTFGLCSFEDPVQALREMSRVCRPDGQLLLLEHGRSYYQWLNDILDQNAEKHTERWGCMWEREIMKYVEEAGLEVKSSFRWHFGTTYVVIAGPRKGQQAELPQISAADYTQNRP